MDAELTNDDHLRTRTALEQADSGAYGPAATVEAGSTMKERR